ncbi:MAG TPA: hypothetical protein VG652_07115 [Gaiellaceae bacterium]|nr:hypothetical protein [Gaiellaceae bacterium]
MIWVTWRQQRTETLIAGGILVLIAALLLPTGITMAHAYHHDGLAACLGTNPSFSCHVAIGGFQSRFQPLFSLLNWFTLIPGLIGVVLAAPFVHELENGTYRLAWTQSITRRRWIAIKLAVPIAAAILIAAVLIVLTTWWRAPFVHLNGRMETGTYDSEGTVVFGYTLFALALALAIGVVWRRAVAAITIAFVGYFIARIFVDTWLRDRLVAPLKATWKASSAQPADLAHARVISELGTGPGISFKTGSGPLGSHAAHIAIPRGLGQGPATMHAVYQPPSHFWPLQGFETGIFVGVALLLIAFAAWWTHERTA